MNEKTFKCNIDVDLVQLVTNNFDLCLLACVGFLRQGVIPPSLSLNSLLTKDDFECQLLLPSPPKS